MKQRLGAILCMVLGAVSIGTGLAGNSAGDVGAAAPDCGTPVVGVAVPCPTGIIKITETTIANGVKTPATWPVQITSTCLDPGTGQPVDQTLPVPDGGSDSSTPLEIFSNPNHNDVCSYAYVLGSIPARCTAVFDPASPQPLPAANPSELDVALTVTCTKPTPTPTPTPTKSSHTATAPATVSATPTVVTPPPSTSSAPIASTGPREQVRASVWIGAALFLLGLVLLVAGRTRRRSRHSG